MPVSLMVRQPKVDQRREIVKMKANVLVRQHSLQGYPVFHEEIGETEDFVIDSNSNEYIYKGREISVARNRKLGSTTIPNSTKNTKGNITPTTTPTTTPTKSSSVRKTSIARIGNAFRGLQQTITPRKIKERKTTDCTFPENNNVEIGKKSQVSRSMSLPNIKEDNNKRAGKKNSMLRKLTHSQSNAYLKNRSIPKLDFETATVISFPSNRLEGYRAKSTDTLSQDELNRMNQRRKTGRSVSVQLPNNREVMRELKRDRSFSTDCEEHLFSFDRLVARRLNSSKETTLCESDL